jgi:putative ABC transport system substrate-binding protein
MSVWFSAVGCIMTLTLSLLVTPLCSNAQQPGKVYRIGFLSQGSAPPPSATTPNLDAFRHRLRELGWVEGQNLAIEYRYAEGREERLPVLAAELVRLSVDVIFAAGVGREAHAAKDATTTIPIVFVRESDPVTGKLVASLARPGGNVTGLSMMTPDLNGKRLELLKEAVPGLTRVAVLYHPAHLRRIQSSVPQTAIDIWKETHSAAQAQALGVQLQWVETEGPDAFDSAFAAMTRERAEALLVIPHGIFGTHRRQLIALAVERRLPTIFWLASFAQDGALIAYGSNIRDEFRRAAAYVDKILRGAKPADLPVEQPTKFELGINLKTAKALGITIPPSLLVLADEVIQ